MTDARNTGNSAPEAYPPSSMVRFALAETALLWMGVLVGPMLVATEVAGPSGGSVPA